MQIVQEYSPSIVELTDAELEAANLFDCLLDRGLSIPRAMREVRTVRPGLGEPFYQYLAR